MTRRKNLRTSNLKWNRSQLPFLCIILNFACVFVLTSCLSPEVQSTANAGAKTGSVITIATPQPSTSPVPSPSPSVSPLPLLPLAGVLDSTCMSNGNSYDACIIHKNPVFQKMSPLSPALTPTSNLDSLLIYGVKLTDLDSSGFLQNSSFFVTPGGTRIRVKANSSGNWKYPFSTNCVSTTCTADTNHNVGQIMAYYWLNYQSKYMLATTGVFYVRNKSIQVTTFKENLFNAYWDGAGNIVMGDGKTSKTEFAMSAEIYLHEMGHANLSYASPGTSAGLGDCSTKQGCIGAIHEGQADYHAFIIFPQNGSPLGEGIINSVSGLSECGITRTISLNKNITAQQAFDACSTKPGEVHLMGRVYASVWYEVRNQVGNDPKEIDQLFSEHLKSLQSSDTFVTALQKIKAVDTALFGAKYGKDFEDEFARRGI